MKNLFLLLFIASIISLHPIPLDKNLGQKERNNHNCESNECYSTCKPSELWEIIDTSFFPTIKATRYDSIFSSNVAFFSDGFDYPVGKPDGNNYFKALKFGQRYHLGEDWNGLGGGNTDLGDPIYSIADGLVVFVEDVCCGWGNVIRVVHKLPNHPQYQYVESVYAHLHNKQVRIGDLVKRGQKLGTIGTAHGKYSAHLHLEMRNFVGMSLGPGYSKDTFGYIAPTDFINDNRPYR